MPAPIRIAAEKAIRKLALDTDERPDFTAMVTVYSGKTKLDTISLDDADDSSDDIVVDGDLVVTGDVTNFDSESGRQLIVTGKLTARSIVAGGAFITVRKGVTVSGGIYAHYNHGALEIGGNVTAPFILASDHGVSIEGKIKGVTASWRGGLDADFDGDSLHEILVPEVYRDDSIDHEAVIARMRNGEPIVKEGVVPPRVRLAQELKDAASKPLRTLDLRRRKLKGFPPDKQLPPSLEVLELGDNPIRKIPGSIDRLGALRELGLASTQLVDLEAVTKLPALERLDLDYVQGPIPKSFPKLKALRRLTISVAGSSPEDRLSLPEGALVLPALERLDMKGLLVDFPSELATLPELAWLNLKDNAFAHIPQLALPKLARLELDNLGALKRPLDFSKLPALRHLVFRGSTLRSNSPTPDTSLLEPIWGLTRLESLDLGNWKQLASLPAAFAKLGALRELQLSGTGIKTLPESLLALTSLELVDLRFTSLAEGEVGRLLSALPNVSLKIDRWPTPPSAGEAIDALLAKSNIHHRLPYAKGRERLAMLEGATSSAFEVIDQLAGKDRPYEVALAQYNALRYGLVMLEDATVAAAAREKILGTLVALARDALAGMPERIRVRDAASEYLAAVRPKAATCLAFAGAQGATSKSDRLAALAHAELACADSDYFTTLAGRLRVRLLVDLGRFDEAARVLRYVIRCAGDDPALRPLQDAPWYRAASAAGSA